MDTFSNQLNVCICLANALEEKIEQQTRLNQYKHVAHSVGIMMLHLEWVTKYRYKIFRKIKYRNLMNACIRRSASRNGIKIIEIDVQPEHVHCVVEVSFSISASKVLQFLKGGSARLFFQFAEKMRLRYPRGHLWSRGKFASSVGFVQLDTVKDYVRNQSVKHSTYGNSTL